MIVPSLELFVGEHGVRVFAKGPGGSYCGVDERVEHLTPSNLLAVGWRLLDLASTVPELDLFSAELNAYWLEHVRPLEQAFPAVRIIKATPLLDSHCWRLEAWRRLEPGHWQKLERTIDATDSLQFWAAVIDLLEEKRES